MKRAGTEIDKQIGLRIRAARIAAGVTQEKLGEALGLTFQQVQKYEKGINRVGPANMLAIAETLDTTVPALFGCGEEQSPGTLTMLATRDGAALAAAFNRIEDAAFRLALVTLAERFADGGETVNAGPPPAIGILVPRIQAAE